MINNTKNTNHGFTIVELLIVIVVIAILAAISIVAYNGIQNRGKSSSGQSLANQVAKKAEAYNTIKSTYPANTAGFAATDAPEAALDNPSAVVAWVTGSGAGGVDAAATYNDGNAVVYRARTGGACVFWWDFSASPAAKKVLTAGAAVAAGTTAGTGCLATS